MRIHPLFNPTVSKLISAKQLNGSTEVRAESEAPCVILQEVEALPLTPEKVCSVLFKEALDGRNVILAI